MSKSISKIEANILKISTDEAMQAWEKNHETNMKSCMELIKSSLPGRHYNKVSLKGERDRDVGAVYYDGSEGNPNRDIPKGYIERDHCMHSVQFEPSLLLRRVKEAWIAKETTRVAETKINHLLSVAGVA